MSHFVVLALVPGFVDQEGVEGYVEEILEPYSENKKVPAYQEKCWCVGAKARNEVWQEVESQLGAVDVHRKAFWAMDRNGEGASEEADKWWEENVRGPRGRLEEELLAKRDDVEAPNPECSDCEGTGKSTTTYNPNSKWDWWTVGGRWTGYYDGYNPEEDPQNQETCPFCDGTGKRMDKVGMEMRETDPAFGCNGCEGRGKRVKWTLERHDGDIFPVENLLVEWDEKRAPFAIVTRDGWFEKGKMGWWAMVGDEKDKDAWSGEAKAALEKYKDHTAVVVDCHI